MYPINFVHYDDARNIIVCIYIRYVLGKFDCEIFSAYRVVGNTHNIRKGLWFIYSSSYVVICESNNCERPNCTLEISQYISSSLETCIVLDFRNICCPGLKSRDKCIN